MTFPALVVAVLVTQAPEPAPFLGEFQIEDRAQARLGPATPLTVTVRIPATQLRPRELDRRFRLRHPEADTVRFEVRGYPASRDPLLPRHRRPSFVIDYDQKPVQALRERFLAQGKPPTLEALTAFVDQSIVKKNLSRGFDFASVVARRAEGDCTEHAVLLAALARSFRLPARVVLGLALVEGTEGLKAFGHAWVEVREGKHWKPADAALRGVTELQYLPLNVLEDESASYLGAAIRQGSLMAVQGLVLEDAPPGE